MIVLTQIFSESDTANKNLEDVDKVITDIVISHILFSYYTALNLC